MEVKVNTIFSKGRHKTTKWDKSITVIVVVVGTVAVVPVVAVVVVGRVVATVVLKHRFKKKRENGNVYAVVGMEIAVGPQRTSPVHPDIPLPVATIVMA